MKSRLAETLDAALKQMKEGKFSGTSIGEIMDLVIENRVNQILTAMKNGEENPPPCPFLTDSLGELVDRLTIANIRCWKLEDEIGDCQDDHKLAAAKRKADIIYKRKRPAFVEAINKVTDEKLTHGRSLVEESTKNYKGHQS